VWETTGRSKTEREERAKVAEVLGESGSGESGVGEGSGAEEAGMDFKSQSSDFRTGVPESGC
jgi:hypothetical protein